MEMVGVKTVRNGAIFVNVTTPKANSPQLRMINDPIQVVAYARGWDGVVEWWPFALATALISGMVGWLLGKHFALDIYEEDADQRIRDIGYKVKEAEKKLSESIYNNNEAQAARREAADIRKMAREMMKTSDAQVQEADDRATEAERKLLKERDDHKKTVAQLINCKAKLKKNKGVDID
jgi:hypothetical protein